MLTGQGVICPKKSGLLATRSVGPEWSRTASQICRDRSNSEDAGMSFAVAFIVTNRKTLVSTRNDQQNEQNFQGRCPSFPPSGKQRRACGDQDHDGRKYCAPTEIVVVRDGAPKSGTKKQSGRNDADERSCDLSLQPGSEIAGRGHP